MIRDALDLRFQNLAGAVFGWFFVCVSAWDWGWIWGK